MIEMYGADPLGSRKWTSSAAS